MPFATSRWPEAAISHLPDADRYRQEPPPRSKRVLQPKPAAKSVNQEAQNRTIDEQLPILRAHLDLGANHPLFDLYDRAALFRALDDFAKLSLTHRRGVHGAVNAAMWLNGAEAPYKPQ
jgi:hypothetical protein